MPRLTKKKPPASSSLDFSTLLKQSLAKTRTLKLIAQIEEFDDTTSITQFVDACIHKAWQTGASDIHIDPQAESLIMRFRIDGVLHDIVTLNKDLQPLIITRIKVLAGLRTDEHLVAQDGRFHVHVDTNDVELRVSILPTFHGENVVMRLLVGGTNVLDLDALGFSEHHLPILERYICKTYGMILATGPTGSGKTTTLYSILRRLNVREVSIVTIEDPIEYVVEGITQLPVNTQTGFTFATGLRSIVRQDPNVIMVGEIRDQETASIAVNAAMTGHLLLSTLHTTDAATTLPRLLDMGIEPFLIASTVNVVIGQRLVRRLCENCREKSQATNEEIQTLTHIITEPLLKIYRDKTFWRPRGCKTCGQTGYTKRIGIYEVLEVSDRIRELIMKRTAADDLREAARQEGMVTMFEDGLQKAADGATSIAEIIRVVND